MPEKLIKQAGRHIDLIILALSSLAVGAMAWQSVKDSLAGQQTALQQTRSELAGYIASNDARLGKVIDDENQIKQSQVRMEQKQDDMLQWLRAREGANGR